MKAIRLYAQVITDVALTPQLGIKLPEVISELNQFSSMIAESPLFVQVFDNPTIGEEDKQKALKEFAQKLKTSVFAQRFLSLLVKRNRLGLLPHILNEVEIIQVEKQGGLVGELVSATPLSASALNGIQEALSKRLKKPVQLKTKVDSALIAGMKVTVSGVTYDGSVKAKLDLFSNHL